MAVQNQQLQQQMSQLHQHVMFMATSPPPTAPPRHGSRHGGRGRGRNSRAPPGPPMYHPPAPYMPPAPAYPPAPGYRPQHNRPSPAPPGYAPHLAYPQPPAGAPPVPPAYTPPYPPPPHYGTAPPYGQTGPAQRPRRPPNAKRYNNLNYCWTHGGDVTDEHTSHTCQRPAHYHQPQATQYNPMGGSQRDMTKTYQGTF
jgi:hypothetical protein